MAAAQYRGSLPRGPQVHYSPHPTSPSAHIISLGDDGADSDGIPVPAAPALQQHRSPNQPPPMPRKATPQYHADAARGTHDTRERGLAEPRQGNYPTDSEALHDTNRHLASNLTVVSAENFALRDRATDANIRLNDAERDRAALVYRLQDQTDRWHEREAEYVTALERLRAERDQLTDALGMARSKLDETRNSEALSTAKRTNATIEAETLRGRIVQLENDLKKAEGLSQQRAKELASMSVAKVKLERQLGRTQSESSAAMAKVTGNVKATEAKVQEQLAHLGELNDALHAAHDEVSHLQARNQAKEHQLNVASENLTAVKDELNERDGLIVTLRATVAEQEARLAQLETLRDERMQKMLQESKAQVDAIHGMMAERTASHTELLAQKQDMVESLQQQLGEARRGTSEHDAVVERLQAEKKRLQEDVYFHENQSHVLRDSVNQRASDLLAAKEEVAELAMQKKAAEVKAEHVERTASERMERCERLEKLIASLRDELGEANGRIAARDSDISRLKQDVARLEEANERASKRLADADAKHHDATVRAETAERAAADLHHALERRKSDEADSTFTTQQQLAAMESRVASLREQQSHAEAQHEAAMSRQQLAHESAVDALNEKHRSQVRALEARLDAVMERVESTQRHAEQDVKSAVAARDEEHTRDVERLTETHTTRIRQIEETHEQRTAQIRKQLDEANERQAATRSQLDETNAKVTSLHEELRNAEQRRVDAVAEEREKARVREMDIVKKQRDEQERMARESRTQQERSLESQDEHHKRQRALQEEHDAIERTHTEEVTRIQREHRVARDADERRIADLEAECDDARNNADTVLDIAMHNLLSHENHVRSALVGYEHGQREALLQYVGKVTARQLRPQLERVVASSLQLVLDEESRCRSLIELVAMIGGEAMAVMAAYHKLRDEHESGAAASHDLHSELRATRSDRDAAVEQLASTEERLATVNSQLRDAVDRAHSAEARAADAESRAAMVDDASDALRRHNELVRLLWELQTKLIGTRRHLKQVFQSDAWRRALERNGIDDALGADLAQVVENVQWAHDFGHNIVATHVSDTEKRHLGTSPHFFKADTRSGSASEAALRRTPPPSDDSARLASRGARATPTSPPPVPRGAYVSPPDPRSRDTRPSPSASYTLNPNARERSASPPKFLRSPPRTQQMRSGPQVSPRR